MCHSQALFDLFRGVEKKWNFEDSCSFKFGSVKMTSRHLNLWDGNSGFNG